VLGAGKLLFGDNELRGEVRDPKDYYKHDRQRFYRYLEDFK
jgi:hypothetical protein